MLYLIDLSTNSSRRF